MYAYYIYFFSVSLIALKHVSFFCCLSCTQRSRILFLIRYCFLLLFGLSFILFFFCLHTHQHQPSFFGKKVVPNKQYTTHKYFFICLLSCAMLLSGRCQSELYNKLILTNSWIWDVKRNLERWEFTLSSLLFLKK